MDLTSFIQPANKSSPIRASVSVTTSISNRTTDTSSSLINGGNSNVSAISDISDIHDKSSNYSDGLQKQETTSIPNGNLRSGFMTANESRRITTNPSTHHFDNIPKGPKAEVFLHY